MKRVARHTESPQLIFVTPSLFHARLFTRTDVSDPKDVSAIGQINGGNRLVAYVASSTYHVGILHAGLHSPDTMFSNETAEQAFSCRVARGCVLFGGLALAYLLSKFRVTTLSNIFQAGVGCSLLVLCTIWLMTYGASDWAGWDSDVWTIAVGLVGSILIVNSVGGVSPSPKKKAA